MANMTGMASLAELRKEFIVRGWHRKATTRVVSGLLLNFAIALAGIYFPVVPFRLPKMSPWPIGGSGILSFTSSLD